MLSWLPWALAIQVLLSFFGAPLPWGVRKVFPGDLWCFAWVGMALVQLGLRRDKHAGRGLWIPVGLTAAVIAIVYLHGAFRPSVVDEIKALAPGLERLQDRFEPGREAVVALRFFSWITGAWIAAWAFRGSVRFPHRALSVSLAVAAALIFAAKFVPGFETGLGKVFGYDVAAVPWWRGRVYGPFSSPIEAATALCLGLIFLHAPPARDRAQLGRRIALTLFVLGSVVLTQTLTPVGCLVIALAGFGFSRLKPAWQWAGGLAGMVAALGAIFWANGSANPRIQDKIHDFLFRFGPWQIYWKTATRRWDLLLLGFGFPDYHVDNSYIFLFNRGGLLLTVFVLGMIARATAKGWAGWNGAQRSALIYMLVSGLTLDSFILRPVVALWIGIGVVVLMRQRNALSQSVVIPTS